MENEKRWWFSLRTHTVEDDDGPTPGKDRLGPFPTREAAAQALVTHTQLTARQIAEESMRIAGRMCIYTNDSVTIEEL